jgi:hypothetical protein
LLGRKTLIQFCHQRSRFGGDAHVARNDFAEGRM